jgi:GTP-binding protein
MGKREESSGTNDYPVVAIVGRPNVGKSTLFNRLIGERKAIVEATPGITRDRIYGDFEWRGLSAHLIDTGGIVVGDPDEIVNLVAQQAEYAIAEADLVIFLLDSKSGLAPDDSQVADILRRSAKRVLAVANKVDNEKAESHAAEFHSLGFDRLLMVSAYHGHGIAELLDAVVEELQSQERCPRVQVEPSVGEPVRLAIVGRPNVGKSSLLNALLGQERAITNEKPGTTRDALDTPLRRNSDSFVLIDTAGIRRRGRVQGSVEFYCVLRAESAIRRAEVACLVLDASEGLTDGDKRIAGLVRDSGTGCIIAANKWDLVEAHEPAGGMGEKAEAEFAQMVRAKMPFVAFAPVCCCSATLGDGTDQILALAKLVSENRSLRIQTSDLNRLVLDATSARPYSRGGKAFKVYYATMARVRPPTVVLFVNDRKLAHFSYVRYLENKIRERYGFVGSPLRIFVRESAGEPQ